MCISANFSAMTFFVSVLSSFVLIIYGDLRYKTENLIIGLFFIYVSLVQLLEWMMWIDIDGKNNINKIATAITPIYVYIQPLVLYNIQLFVYNIKINSLILFLQIIYLIITFIQYYKYIINDNLLPTKYDDGTLKWRWVAYFNVLLYFIVLIYSIFVFMPIKISLLLFIFGIISLFIAYLKHKKSSSSFFCLFSAFAPIIFILFEQFL